MKLEIRPVGAELFHADEQTDGEMDMTKLIVTFRNFAKSACNVSYYTTKSFTVLSSKNIVNLWLPVEQNNMVNIYLLNFTFF